MEARVRCPKCESQNVSVTRDRQLRWGKSKGDEDLVLLCKACGKTLYGDAVTEVLKRAREEAPVVAARTAQGPSLEERVKRFAAEGRQRLVASARLRIAALAEQAEVERARLTPARRNARGERVRGLINLVDVEAAHIARLAGEVFALGVTAGQAEAWVKTAEANLRSLTSRVVQVLASPEAEAPPGKGPTVCVWADCPHPRREGSEYCSNDCRIKKARYKYDIKRGRVKPEALSSAA